MADNDFKKVSLYAEHEPAPGPSDNHPRPDSVEVGAGHVIVGVEIDGVRLPLQRYKASDIREQIEQAKSSKSQSKPSSGE